MTSRRTLVNITKIMRNCSGVPEIVDPLSGSDPLNAKRLYVLVNRP